jgi:hypothetical protein
MKSSFAALISLCTLVAVLVGCGTTELKFTKKPSYADLVVTYNAELETLEKLEAKREKLVADHLSQTQQAAIKAAVNSIQSGEAQAIPSDPNAALDRAVAAAEMQAQLQSGLSESLGLSSESGAAPKYPEALQRQLAGLDAEIADQQARVQRAKAARDAAQPSDSPAK